MHLSREKIHSSTHWKTPMQYQIEQKAIFSTSLKDWLSTKVPVVTQSSAGNILWEWRWVRGDTSRIYYCAYSLPCTLVKQCCATKIRDHLKCTTQYLMSVAQYLLSVVPYILLQNCCLCYVVTCVQFYFYFGIMYSEVIFKLAVVVCMCERLTPDTLSTQTEAQDDAHRRAPILRHKASKSNWISTIFTLLPTKNTSVDYETHGK